jgi:hypothetical protein
MCSERKSASRVGCPNGAKDTGLAVQPIEGEPAGGVDQVDRASKACSAV